MKKHMLVVFFLVSSTLLIAQDETSKIEILRSCLHVAEMSRVNHLQNGKAQLFIKTTDSFKSQSTLKWFSNPVVFVSFNSKINTSYISIEKFEFVDSKSAKVVFEYKCINCRSWRYELEFTLFDRWEISKNITTEIK